ncbi:MAG: hypothetical protein HOY71_20585 [Nonomuraea sp.]|nr:hypothetical protein [Nonomuraea sp.]
MAMVKGMRRSLREVIGARGLVLDGDERMDSIMNFATADELVGWIRRAATASSPEEFFDAAATDDSADQVADLQTSRPKLTIGGYRSGEPLSAEAIDRALGES